MKTRFLIPARQELHSAIRYYNVQRLRLGDEFRDEVWETIQRIKKFPLPGIAWAARSGAAKCSAFHMV